MKAGGTQCPQQRVADEALTGAVQSVGSCVDRLKAYLGAGGMAVRSTRGPAAGAAAPAWLVDGPWGR